MYESTSSLHAPFHLHPVQRARINQIIKHSLDYGVITVTAGAGQGKTQAISLYLADHPELNYVWIGLSELDNLPSRFWETIIRSIALKSETLAHTLSEISFPQTADDFEQFLHILTKEVYISSEYIIVLDDLHLIHEPSILAFIENFLFAAVENLTFILLSRKYLNFDYPQMFTNDLLFRIRERDLCFTRDEIESFLQLQEIDYTPEQPKQIYDATEGWALAVALYVVALSRKENIFAQPEANVIDSINDLFDREVFSGYSKRVKEFLIRLSYLEEFPVKLLAEISDLDPNLILDVLDENMFIRFNPFLEACEIHNLYLMFLRQKQIYQPDELRQDVYRKTAEWYQSQGMTTDALIYFDKCGDHASVWHILDHFDKYRLARETAQFHLELISHFPSDFIAKTPRVRVHHASLLFNNMQIEQAIQELTALKEEMKLNLEDPVSRTCLGDAYLLLGLLQLGANDPSFKQYFIKGAELLLPDGSAQMGRKMTIIDFDNAIRPPSLQQTDIDEMLAAYDEAFPYFTKAVHGCGQGIVELAHAEIEFFSGNLRDAEHTALKALFQAKMSDQYDIICNSYLILIRIMLASGNYDRLTEYWTELHAYAKGGECQRILDIIDGWLYCKLRVPHRVASWIIHDSIYSKVAPPISAGREQIIKYLYYSRSNRHLEALALLDSIEPLYKAHHSWLNVLAVLVAKAATLHNLGQNTQAVAALEEVYHLIKDSDLHMMIVEVGAAMRSLIESAKRMGGHTIPDDWLDRMLTKTSTYAKRQTHIVTEFQKKHNLAIDNYNLTAREQEILDDLCQGLSRAEISEARHISINTVKSMLKTIYNKIGASNLADAVRIGLVMKADHPL